jgi:hypothetical protein
MISLSSCPWWQPDTATKPAEEHRSYTTSRDTIAAFVVEAKDAPADARNSLRFPIDQINKYRRRPKVPVCILRQPIFTEYKPLHHAMRHVSQRAVLFKEEDAEPRTHGEKRSRDAGHGVRAEGFFSGTLAWRDGIIVN